MIPLAMLPLSPLIQATGLARDRALARAPQAEWGLAHQGARVLLSRDQSSGWLVRRAGLSLVALGRPLGDGSLSDLARTARAQGLMPLLYKCDAATAQAARAQGWRTLRLGCEAILDLPRWRLDRPACRQLRRKLRAASSAGIVVTHGTDLPLPAMEAVARDWAIRHGGERGFSMGRFDPGLLQHQRVLLARNGDRLVAFATFHASREEWTLDLMRHSADMPDGTMHTLIVHAAELARTAGATRLSLAAIPEPPGSRSWLRALGLGACGLAQFKRSFGPRLSPRYAAAPGPLSLAAGLAAVGRAIHRPGPLPQTEERRHFVPRRSLRMLERRPHGPHFGFEPAPVPCDARPAKPREVALPLPGRRSPP